MGMIHSLGENMRDYIMQMRPLFGEEEKAALAAYMDEDGFLTEFKYTAAFEEEIKKFTGAKYCFAVNNGTVALTVAALAAGIGHGDEIIVPNFTMVATPNSVKLLGARVKFVDVEPASLCLNINEVEKAITPKTKAIMLVAANGRYPAHGIKNFEKLALEHGLVLIEDAAQALGSYYPDGRHVGRAGLVSTFSFSAPKIISTGQGGAIITDDEQVANSISKLKDFGRTGGGNDIHDVIGFNFKFTELQAVVGIQQMKKLNKRITRKKEIYTIYSDLLIKSKPSVKMINNDLRYTTPWFYEILCDRKEELKGYLLDKNIGTRDMYPPINRQKAYNTNEHFLVSENIGEKGLWLPSQVQLTDEQLEYICTEINKFYG
jgi:perosamine synthetase